MAGNSVDQPRKTFNVIKSHELEFVRHVGAGGTSQISLCRWITGGVSKVVVKKTLFRGSASHSDQSILKREISILAQLHHDNIVSIYGIVASESDCGLIMEFCKHGSYRNFSTKVLGACRHMNDLPTRIAPLKLRIISEVVCAMRYIHSRRILHLDLKPDNVLLDSGLHVKVCDFGLSQIQVLSQILTRSNAAMEKHFGGTPGYIAPEHLRDFNCIPSTKTDIFAFGVLACEILTDRVPYADLPFYGNIMLLGQHVALSNLRPDINVIPDVFPDDLTGIVVRSWGNNPHMRPSFEELDIELRRIVREFPSYEEKLEECRLSLVFDTNETDSLETPTGQSREASKSMPTSAYRVCRPASVTAPKFHSEQEARHCWSACLNGPLRERLGRHADTDDETAPLLGAVEKRIVSPKKVVTAVSAALACVAIVLTVTLLTTRKPDCNKLSSPRHGSLHCTSSGNFSSRCVFHCDDGFGLIGEAVTTCVGGKWDHAPPTCGRECRVLPHVANSKVNCSNGTFDDSICVFTCLDNHVIQGNSTIICLNGTWTSEAPTCTCPACATGDKCEQSLRWIDVVNQIGQAPYSHSTVHYGGREFSCDNGIIKWFKYHCRCHDDKHPEYDRNCEGYDSPSGSCEHAAAQLIRDLVAVAMYPEPCDKSSMPTDC